MNGFFVDKDLEDRIAQVMHRHSVGRRLRGRMEQYPLRSLIESDAESLKEILSPEEAKFLEDAR